MKFKDENQVLEIVKNPKNKDLVIKGRKYESRLRLFTEPMEEEDLRNESSWIDFKKFAKEVLSIEQELSISKFIQFPLSSISITESLMSDIYKVFDAGNSFFDYKVVSIKKKEKIQKTLSKLSLVNWIEETGKAVLKNKPNSVIVIDKDENGEPFILSIDNDRLQDIELRDCGIQCEYVSFFHSITTNEKKQVEYRTSVYDDENYYVVLNIEGKYTLESTTKHNSKLCPARMFLEENLNSKSNFLKKVPLSNSLSKLTEWQQFDIYKYYTDHYAPFPVVEMVREKCTNDACENGWTNREVTDFAGGNTSTRVITERCPQCEGKNKVGIGSKILLDPPDEDKKDAGGKFRMISNPTENLEYIQSKLDIIENNIKTKVVGYDNILSNEAVNEKQVKGSFESRTNVLLKTKTNLDNVYVWIVKTIADLYFDNTSIEVSANFGTEWYLVSANEIQDRFKLAVEAGLPEEEIDMLYKQLIETKYKGNSDKIERLKLINKLDPIPYKNLETKKQYLELGLIEKEDLIISERLITFVNRFENENGSILSFGEEIEENKKLNTIYEQFKKYTSNGKESTSK